MANRHWVGGPFDVWNGTAATKWAATSGGAGGEALPTAADDVFFDLNSGSSLVSINGSRVCRSFNSATFLGSFTGAGTPILTIGDASGGSFTLGPAHSWGSIVSLVFASTSTNGGAGWSITTIGKTLGAVTFDGVGGKWTLADSLTSDAQITLENGHWDTNSQTVTAISVNSNNSNTRSLTLGTSTMNMTRISPGGGIWNITTSTGMTLSAASSTIVAATPTSFTGRFFGGGGLTYGTLTYTVAGSWSDLVISGSNTFNTINVGPGRKILFTAGTTNTVTNWNVVGAANGFQVLGGISGNYISTPDSVPLSITGDITVMTRLHMDDYTPTTNQTLFAKRNAGANQRSYSMTLGITGSLLFTLSADGTAGTAATATSDAGGFADGSLYWILACWRQSDGRVQFFSADGTITDPVASDFTQIGADKSISTVTVPAIFDSTTPLEIGSQDLGTVQLMSGRFYRVKIYNGVFSTSAYGGTVQFDANFSTKPIMANSFTEGSANAATVTMTGVDAQRGDGRVVVSSSTAATHTLSKSSGVVSSNYLDISYSIAQGGATWYAGGNSTDSSNNTGWIFGSNTNFLQMF